ncbi:MAG TPA: cation:proton antiporter, partial [Thermoanaerobaculia bacterium]|nr:cation:proton antiporter [Thermoanaerobaculia bacterium]
MNHWIEGLPAELEYVLLLFVLFVVPRLLQRFRIPSAISALALGAAAGMGLGLFRQDSTVNLLSTLGIVSLFLFAGLDIDFRELRHSGPTLLEHLAIRVVLLLGVAFAARFGLNLEIQAAVLMALALTTPSTGFILDSLASLGGDDRE